MIIRAENLLTLFNKSDSHLFFKAANELISFCEQGQSKQSLTHSLLALPHEESQALELWAQKISLFSSCLGQKAINCIRITLSDTEKRKFDDIGNQYDRSLWLYKNRIDLFERAISIRFDCFNYSAIGSSTFPTKENLSIRVSQKCQERFKSALSEILGCTAENVAIKLSEAEEPPIAINIGKTYLITVIFNYLPEVTEKVEKGFIADEPIRRSKKFYIAYNTNTGFVDVYFPKFSKRLDIFNAFSEHLLCSQAPYRYKDIPQYNIQKFAEDEPIYLHKDIVSEAKVTSLSYKKNGREVKYKITLDNGTSIHDAAKEDLGGHFTFSNHSITKAKISIKLRENTLYPERNVYIIFNSVSECKIQAGNTCDFIICRWLIHSWGLLNND